MDEIKPAPPIILRPQHGRQTDGLLLPAWRCIPVDEQILHKDGISVLQSCRTRLEDILTVDLGSPKLSSRNTVVKQYVNFTECAILGLRQTEPAPDVAEEIRAGIEEGRLCSPVPLCICQKVSCCIFSPRA